MDDSVITCDEIIDAQAKSNNEERKLISKNFNEKNIFCKMQNLSVLLAFSSIPLHELQL